MGAGIVRCAGRGGGGRLAVELVGGRSHGDACRLDNRLEAVHTHVICHNDTPPCIGRRSINGTGRFILKKVCSWSSYFCLSFVKKQPSRICKRIAPRLCVAICTHAIRPCIKSDQRSAMKVIAMPFMQ